MQKTKSPQICNAAYQKARAPRDNPSIVLYQTEIMVFGDGKTPDAVARAGGTAIPCHEENTGATPARVNRLTL